MTDPRGEPRSMQWVAKRLKWSVKQVRDRLQEEHLARGRTLLFRRSAAKNSKLYVYDSSLVEIFPRTFGSGARAPLHAALDQLDVALKRVRDELRAAG